MSSPLDAHLAEMVSLSQKLSGCMTEKEVHFLSLLASTLPPTLGEVLEIGSYMGKSTTLLAKSVGRVGGNRVVAVDPLTLPASTDPSTISAESLPAAFWQTLESNGVRHLVEFHQVFSGELARTWNRPLRLLWIDGDHTYPGVIEDFDRFAPHLRPGSVVAFHDVLHGFEGPIRGFCERVLLSPAFGPCGLCGSIGWAQYVGGSDPDPAYTRRKLSLYRQLSRLIPLVALGEGPQHCRSLRYKALRALVPHGKVETGAWTREVARHWPGGTGA